MANKVKLMPTVSELNGIVPARLGTNTVANAGHLTDADIGKPLKLVAADRYGLCADGDVPEGWLVSVNPDTDNGYAYGSVQTGNMVQVELDGAVTIGALVAAAAPAAARTAEDNGLGKVSAHTGTATDKARWQLVSGTGLDGDTTAVIKRC